MDRIRIVYLKDNQDWVSPHLSEILNFGKQGFSYAMDDGTEQVILSDKELNVPVDEEADFVDIVADMDKGEVRSFDNYGFEIEYVDSILI